MGSTKTKDNKKKAKKDAKKKAALEAAKAAEEAARKAAELAEQAKKMEAESDSSSDSSDSSDSDSDSDSSEEAVPSKTKNSAGDEKSTESDSESDDEEPKEKEKVAEAESSSDSSSSSSSDSSDSDSDEDETKEKKSAPVAKKSGGSSSDSESSSDSDEKEDTAKGDDRKKVSSSKDPSSSSSSDSDSSHDDSDATPDSDVPDADQKIAKKRKDEGESFEKPPRKKQAVAEDTDGVAKIYVRGLPWRATQEEVEDFFKSCGGGTKSVELPLQDDGRSSGTAIIEFHDAASAAAAIELNGADFNGRWLSIKYSTPKPIMAPRELTQKLEGCVTVFIGNLAWEVDEDAIRECFKDCGTITQIRFATDRETGDFKGFGHIEFAETEATDAAVKLAGTDICGRSVRVDFANDRQGGRGDGGRGGGRGGGRDREKFGGRGGGGGGGRGGRGGGRGGGSGGRGYMSAKKSGAITGFSGTKITF